MSSVARLQPEAGFAPDEVLGTIAHELRQPLSHIESIAYHLAHLLRHEEGEVQTLLLRVRQLVEHADRILSSGLRLTGPLAVSPEPASVEEWIDRAIAAHCVDRARVRVECAADLPEVRLDPQHGFAMIDLLLQTWLPVATPGSPLTVRLRRGEPGGVRFELEAKAASGCALGAGAALAIECARRIARAHGGDLTEEAGLAECMLRVVVMLP